MNSIHLSVIALLCLTQNALCQQFHVEASRTAIVYEEPDTESRELLRLERGDRLNLVSSQQHDNFYNAILPEGQTGWVSKYRVRLVQGIAHEEPAPAPAVGMDTGLTSNARAWAAFHLAIGKPGGAEEIIREGYAVGYDSRLKIASWVQYRLTAENSDDNSVPRSDAFDEDTFVHRDGRATLEDYASAAPRYVRGHMAPAEDMRWDESVERECNLLSNMAPQIGSTFNGSIWKTLENRIREWVRDRGDLTIISGPVFMTRASGIAIERQPQTQQQVVYNVVGEGNVAVPTAFFKIIIDMRRPDNPDVLAFLVPHRETRPGPERQVNTYLTSIDRIEELTGLDFLTALADATEDLIEARVAPASW